MREIGSVMHGWNSITSPKTLKIFSLLRLNSTKGDFSVANIGYILTNTKELVQP